MAVKTFTDNTSLPASDINTYLNNGGLVYITSATVGSGVASVTVSNCFSADFDNYRITWAGIVNSIAANSLLQLSGITTNVYSTGGVFFNYGSATVNGYGPAATSSWLPAPLGITNSQGFADLFSPFLTKTKGVVMGGTSTDGHYHFMGTCTSTSSATGFVFSSNSGTMTGGTITVYGYRKA